MRKIKGIEWKEIVRRAEVRRGGEEKEQKSVTIKINPVNSGL